MTADPNAHLQILKPADKKKFPYGTGSGGIGSNRPVTPPRGNGAAPAAAGGAKAGGDAGGWKADGGAKASPPGAKAAGKK